MLGMVTGPMLSVAFLEPDDLIARLVAAVPPPRFRTLRYFGVLCSPRWICPTPPKPRATR